MSSKISLLTVSLFLLVVISTSAVTTSVLALTAIKYPDEFPTNQRSVIENRFQEDLEIQVTLFPQGINSLTIRNSRISRITVAPETLSSSSNNNGGMLTLRDFSFTVTNVTLNEISITKVNVTGSSTITISSCSFFDGGATTTGGAAGVSFLTLWEMAYDSPVADVTISNNMFESSSTTTTITRDTYVVHGLLDQISSAAPSGPLDKLTNMWTLRHFSVCDNSFLSRAKRPTTGFVVVNLFGTGTIAGTFNMSANTVIQNRDPDVAQTGSHAAVWILSVVLAVPDWYATQPVVTDQRRVSITQQLVMDNNACRLDVLALVEWYCVSIRGRVRDASKISMSGNALTGPTIKKGAELSKFGNIQTVALYVHSIENVREVHCSHNSVVANAGRVYAVLAKVTNYSNVHATIVNNNSATTTSVFTVRAVEFSVCTLYDSDSLTLNFNSLDMRLAADDPRLVALIDFLHEHGPTSDSKLLSTVKSPEADGVRFTSRPDINNKIRNERKKDELPPPQPWELCQGWTNVATVNSSFNKVRVDGGLGHSTGIAALTTFRNVGMVIISHNDIFMKAPMGVTIGDHITCVAIKKRFTNVHHILIEHNTGVLDFVTQTAAAVFTLSVEEPSVGLHAVTFRHNHATVLKRNYSRHERSVVALRITVDDAINSTGAIEFSNNIALISSDGPHTVCPAGSCTAIGFISYSPIHGIDALVLADNYAEVNSSGNGATGLAIYSVDSIDNEVDFNSRRIKMFNGVLDGLKRLSVERCTFLISDPMRAIHIGIGIAGLFAAGSVRVADCTFIGTYPGVTSVESCAVGMGCPVGELTDYGLTFQIDCDLADVRIPRLVVENVVLSNAKRVVANQASYTGDEVIMRNVTFTSDYSDKFVHVASPQPQQLPVGVSSSAFVTFRWEATIRLLVLQNFSMTAVGPCQKPTAADLAILIFAAHRMTFVYAPELSSSSSLLVENATVSLVCTDALSSSATTSSIQTRSIKYVPLVYLGKSIVSVNINNSRFRVRGNDKTSNINSHGGGGGDGSVRTDLVAVFSPAAESTSSPGKKSSINISKTSVFTTGSPADTVVSASDDESNVPFEQGASGVDNIVTSLDCVRWNSEPVATYRFHAVRASLGAGIPENMHVRPCPGVVPSFTQSQEDVSPTDTLPETQSAEQSLSKSRSNEIPPPDIGLSKQTLQNLQTASQVGASVAAVVANNPSALLAAMRGNTLLRLAMCRMAGLQASKIPEKDAFFENHTAKRISRPLEFPTSLIPGFTIGDRKGAAFRGALVTNIVLVTLVGLLTVYLGSLNRASWVKYVLTADREAARIESVISGTAAGVVASPLGSPSQQKRRLNQTGTGTPSPLRSPSSSLRPSASPASSSFSPASSSLLSASPSSTHRRFEPHNFSFGDDGADDGQELLVQEQKQRRHVWKQRMATTNQHGDDYNYDDDDDEAPTKITTTTTNQIKKANGDGGEQDESYQLSRSAQDVAHAASEMSVFLYCPVDKFFLKVLILMMPAWAEVAGGLAAAKPGGGGDVALAVMPLICIGLFVVFMWWYVWGIVSPPAEAPKKKKRLPNKKAAAAAAARRAASNKRATGGASASSSRSASSAACFDENYDDDDGSKKKGKKLSKKELREKRRLEELNQPLMMIDAGEEGDYGHDRDDDGDAKQAEPKFWVEKSALYFPLGASSECQSMLHRALQHPLSTMFLTGAHAWNNNYINLYRGGEILTGPGFYTICAYIAATYFGPEKRPPKKARSASSSSSSKKRKSKKKMKKKTNSKNGDMDVDDDDDPTTTRLVYENTFAMRMCTTWIFFPILTTMISMAIAGAGDAAPASCYGAFIAALLLTIPSAVAACVLRPYAVPFRNVAVIVLECTVALGGVIFAILLASVGDDANELDVTSGAIVAAQLLSTLPAAIIGPAVTALTVVRVVMLRIGRSKIVSLSALREHLPYELNLAEQKMRGVATGQQEKTKFGIDASWFFDD